LDPTGLIIGFFFLALIPIKPNQIEQSINPTNERTDLITPQTLAHKNLPRQYFVAMNYTVHAGERLRPFDLDWIGLDWLAAGMYVCMDWRACLRLSR